MKMKWWRSINVALKIFSSAPEPGAGSGYKKVCEYHYHSLLKHIEKPAQVFFLEKEVLKYLSLL